MTSSSWQRVHDRHALTQRVLRDLARRGADEAVEHHLAEIERQFGTVEQFRLHAEHRWRLRVETALDQAMEPGHPVESADEAATLRTESTARLERLVLALRAHPSGHGSRPLSVPA